MDTALFETFGERLEAFWARFAQLFQDIRRARLGWVYLCALLTPRVGRRNAARLAEVLGTVTPRALQKLLTNTGWGVARFIARLQQYVGEQWGAADGTFILDDSGFPCQGTTRAGAAQQAGRAGWLIIRQTVDGREPRYFLTNAPATRPVADLGHAVGARWGIEAEVRLGKSDLGLDEYDVRSWPGWYHHILLCLLANAVLLELQQDGEKKGAGDFAQSGTAGAAEVAVAAALARRGDSGMGGRDPMPDRAREALPDETVGQSTHGRVTAVK